MVTQRLHAKTSIAPRGGVLRRERLFALLDATGAKAIWIAEPPGAGKTTLVSSWVEARRRRCLWYRVQAADGDLASFFYTLLRARGTRAAAARFRSSPPSTAGGESAFARRFFRQLSRGGRAPWALAGGPGCRQGRRQEATPRLQAPRGAGAPPTSAPS